MAHPGAVSLRPAGMCLQSSGSWVLYSRTSSCLPSLSTHRTGTMGFSTLGQETAPAGAQVDLTEAAVEPCPESWCSLRSLLISVSAMLPSTLRGHKDASVTKAAPAQTAAAHCAAAVDTTSSNRHAASAAIAGSTGVATCCVRSVVSQSGSMCASKVQFSQSQLPLLIQDSRWRACPFRPLLLFKHLFCSLCNSPRKSVYPPSSFFLVHHLGSIFSL